MELTSIMETVTAGTPTVDPPDWATLQRSLFAAMAEAAEPILEHYVEADGSVLWPPSDDYTVIDALDDVYESFFNWPLLYLLGGDDRYLDVARREFDAITEQFSQYDTGHGHPMVVDEYEQWYD